MFRKKRAKYFFLSLIFSGLTATNSLAGNLENSHSSSLSAQEIASYLYCLINLDKSSSPDKCQRLLLKSHNKEAIIDLIKQAISEDKYREALRLAQKLHKMYPNDLKTLEILATTLYLNKKENLAVKYALKAFEKGSKNIPVLLIVNYYAIKRPSLPLLKKLLNFYTENFSAIEDRPIFLYFLQVLLKEYEKIEGLNKSYQYFFNLVKKNEEKFPYPFIDELVEISKELHKEGEIASYLEKLSEKFKGDEKKEEYLLDKALELGNLTLAKKLGKELGYKEDEILTKYLRWLYSEEKINKVNTLLKKFLKEYPDSKELLIYASSFYILTKQIPKAENIIKTLLLKYKENIPSAIPKAYAKYVLEHYTYFTPTQLELLKNILNNKELYKPNSIVKLELEALYALKIEKNYPKAARLFKELIKRASSAEEKIKYLAYLVQTLDKFQDSAKIKEELFSLATPKEILGAAYFALENKDYDLALKLINLLSEEYQTLTDEERKYLLYLKGVVLDRMGKTSQAEEVFFKLLKEYPNFADAYNYLGYTYLLKYGKKKIDNALEFLKKAASLEPENYAILDSLGWAYFVKGDYEKAEKYIRKALQKGQREPIIDYHYAMVLLKLGKISEAKKYALKSCKEFIKQGLREEEKGFTQKLKELLKILKLENECSILFEN
jgi:Flp pilus assembly protein TadD